ncbi:molybdopterin-dependent oxidoreductase [Chitinophagaceae bacterium MMS25-I14]
MKQVLFTAVTIFLLCTAHMVQAQADTLQLCINVNGEVPQSLQLCAADLAALPHITVNVPDKKGAPGKYSGVALADILSKAGAFSGNHKADMTRYVLVTCADGYKVLFTVSDFDKNFGNRTAILADKIDGKPLPQHMGPYRIVLQGEKKMARSCYKVTTFTIGSVKAGPANERQ